MDIDKFIVDKSATIRESIELLDTNGNGILIVLSDNKVIGVVTDGDVRRAILRNDNLSQCVENIANTNFIYLPRTHTPNDILDIFKKTVVRHIPVIDNGNLIDLILKVNYFTSSNDVKYEKIDIPVVIMAGGKGTRLEPFTHILPKPLIPIGTKTIIEHIIDEYRKHFITEFLISVNYKARMMQVYFDELEKDYNVNYIFEDKPLGTIGSLNSLTDKINTAFFVSNCDIIVKEDYSKIFKFHNENKFTLTLVASIKNIKVPYGVCKTTAEGELLEIVEKPEYDFLVNTGMYIIEPHALNYIPKDIFFNVTDLMDVLKANGFKVGVYPVPENAWIDVGQWEEYKMALSKLVV